MNTFLRDLRYALRLLLKNPGYTAVAVITLALGIGANTSIFALVETVLLRPLPYRQPERLVHVWETRTGGAFRQMEASFPNYADWTKLNPVFESLGGYDPTNFTLAGNISPERISGTRVTTNFFSLVGVEPQAGRVFRPEEETRGAPPVAIVTHGFWQRRLGGDASAIGRVIHLSGVAHTVIGILPPSFLFPLDANSEVWVPLSMDDDQIERRSFHWLRTIARLKPGVSLEQAQEEMAALSARLAQAYPATNTDTGVRLVPLHDEIVGETRPVLLLLLGAVGLLLMLACLNVANLVLARSTAREREIAIRVALGAGRGRLVWQLLLESLVLALLGGAAALLLAAWAQPLLLAILPSGFSDSANWQKETMTLEVMGFAFAISLLSGVLFGLAPAVHAARIPLNEALKEGGRAGQRRPVRLRGLLVVGEVAMALVLLAGTGLALRSLGRLLEVSPGFRTENLLTMQLSLPAARYARPEQVADFYSEIQQRVAALPGVVGAAVIDEMPLTHDGGTSRIFVQGRPEPPPGKEQEAVGRTASFNYFQMMGIPLIAGRFFSENDHVRPGVLPVAVLSQTLARQLFPGEDPVGRRLYMKYSQIFVVEVVGVVADVSLAGPEKAIRPAFYTCALQTPSNSNHLIIRTTLDTASLASAIRREVSRLDPEIAVYAVRTMEQALARTGGVSVRRSVSSLLGVFAGLALLLAAVGLYGVMSYAVNERTAEIGVRMALGAQPRDVLRLVVGAGMKLAAVGVAIGTLAALALTRLMSSVLFRISAHDPATFSGVAAVLVFVAFLACWIPARRAAKVDPIVALRYE